MPSPGIGTVLTPGMVISMEPMLTNPEGHRGQEAAASTTSPSSPRQFIPGAGKPTT
jgi:Xaa-Pro aminopeptidase